MHDELNFLTLDRIYEQVMRDGEEKMSLLLIMVNVTPSLKNLDVQMLLKKADLQPPTVPFIHHMPSTDVK